MIDANECLAAAKALLDRLPPTAETTARALAWIDLAREVRLASWRATPDGDAGKGASGPKVASGRATPGGGKRANPHDVDRP